MIATIMSANVLFWIIPGQRKVVAALKAGQPVDPIHGKRGKQRSVHNTYFTLPVLFAMLSNHYSMTYAAKNNWAVLIMLMLAGVLIRQFFILKHKGKINFAWPAAGVACLGLVAFMIAPQPRQQVASNGGDAAANAVSFVKVQEIINTRCVQCHAEQPKMMPTLPAALARPRAMVQRSRTSTRRSRARSTRVDMGTWNCCVRSLHTPPRDQRSVLSSVSKQGLH